MRKKQRSTEQPTERRAFLKSLGLAGGAAAVAAASGEVLAREADTPAEADARSGGYRETDHIRQYYRTARG